MWYDNSYLGELFYKKNFDEKLETRTQRTLAKYNQDKIACNIMLKEEIPNNERLEEKDIVNNEKGGTGCKNHSYVSLTKDTKRYKQSKKNNSGIFETKKYSCFEKKIFKELDYIDYLKNNRTISNKVYKKIICKKYGLGIAIPIVLVLFLLTVFIVDLALGLVPESKGGLWYELGLWGPLKNLVDGKSGWLYTFLNSVRSKLPTGFTNCGKWVSSEASAGGSHTCWEACTLNNLFGYVVYFIPFIILGLIFIIKVVYYHKKVKKYQKIKLRKK
ncbi:Plasmodium exported protein (Pm-fam-a like), unknown function [Plasmodium malariae]|uniref:Fam-l protein n=1 Tax=Plasmodium malariae TaxID=5858 RepID=A0A1A8WSX8_PLAMA|nr:Plasmodium exported protein (Pm-fam-a like), unknown function [Plasmodium malariae]